MHGQQNMKFEILKSRIYKEFVFPASRLVSSIRQTIDQALYINCIQY